MGKDIKGKWGMLLKDSDLYGDLRTEKEINSRNRSSSNARESNKPRRTGAVKQSNSRNSRSGSQRRSRKSVNMSENKPRESSSSRSTLKTNNKIQNVRSESKRGSSLRNLLETKLEKIQNSPSRLPQTRELFKNISRGVLSASKLKNGYDKNADMKSSSKNRSVR